MALLGLGVILLCSFSVMSLDLAILRSLESLSTLVLMSLKIKFVSALAPRFNAIVPTKKLETYLLNVIRSYEHD
jgi:hypothetical protein